MFTQRVQDLFDHLFHCLQPIERASLGDVDEQDGVLRLKIQGMPSLYIIHSHQTLEQVWVSSPLSGGLHFSFDTRRNRWYDTRTDQELISMLAQELKNYLPEDLLCTCFQPHA
jgi:iron donor protein CyaY